MVIPRSSMTSTGRTRANSTATAPHSVRVGRPLPSASGLPAAISIPSLVVETDRRDENGAFCDEGP